MFPFRKNNVLASHDTKVYYFLYNTENIPKAPLLLIYLLHAAESFLRY